MNENEWIELIEVHRDRLLSLAREASEAIMLIRADDQELGVTLKGDQSPVTRADIAAHNIIVAGLEEITPEILIVSEEDESRHKDRVSVAAYWLVDPLDGTKEFINGYDDFTVNMGLVLRDPEGVGYTRFGVVGFPARRLYYSGGIGLGAYRHTYTRGQWSSEPISVSPPQTPLRVVTSRSHLSQETLDYVDSLGVPVQLIKAGSASKFCMIAEGRADLYPRLSPINEWDIAAGHAVLEGAGGQVETDHGFISYGQRVSLRLMSLIARSQTLKP